MPAKLPRIKVKDCRSIGSCEVELQPLTLLVGPNGAGKSNFLDALRFVVHSLHAPFDQVVEARASGISALLRKMPGGQTASNFQIRLDFEIEEQRGSYALSQSRA